jgi:hypothetical protein
MIKEPPIWQGKGARHFRQREREREKRVQILKPKTVEQASKAVQ